jgi:hypothetical protein
VYQEYVGKVTFDASLGKYSNTGAAVTMGFGGIPEGGQVRFIAVAVTTAVEPVVEDDAEGAMIKVG